QGADMVRSEDGQLVGYVVVDVTGMAIADYVKVARRVVDEKAGLPTGTRAVWAGQFESIVRMVQKLKVVLPLTLFIVFVLLYLNTRSLVETAIVLLAVPFSLIGAVWLLYLLGYNMSAAVWVGLI